MRERRDMEGKPDRRTGPKGRRELTFGQNLRRLRVAKNLTLQDVADEIGSKRNTVSEWERDVNMPSFVLGVRVSDLLDVHPRTLVDGVRLVAGQRYKR